MRYLLMFCLICLLASAGWGLERVGGKTMSFDLGTRYLRWTIGTDGTTQHFVNKRTKAEYASGKQPFAQIKKAGTVVPASKAVYANGKITASFGDSGITAVIGFKNCGKYLTFEVLSVTGTGIEELAFLTADLKLKGTPKETFAASALALNLRTNVDGIPGATGHLRAACVPRFGMVGAKVAIIGCPTKELRSIMKEVVTAAPDLPHSPIGGPWAYDSKNNRGSYLFNFGEMSEQTVDSWIKMVKGIGITQIDFHGGGSFRFGDCLPNPVTYPNGRKSFKAVIDKLHKAGILAGLHTYAFFIDKRTPWVTPIPSPDLAKDATFTLAKSISETDATVEVNETTKDMSTIMGFAVRNSVTIQIDNEFITYTGVSKEAPYSFTGCTRGANGTKIVAHAAGAKVYHMKECFGLFAPDPDSKLFMEMIQANADFYNECGFDMIYLDALDGEDILGGNENSWHYGSKFVFELVKRLKKPAIMEMSTFHHHLWFVRARMGAWDHANRGYKDFVDMHTESNKSCLNMFLPAHLGWWGIITSNSPYVEATYTDDTEYVLAKCAGWDCGLSPMVFTPETYATSYNLKRLGGLIKKWEDLRLSGYFTEADKSKLKVPGAGFTLVEEKGRSRVRRMENKKHKVEGLDSASCSWTVANSYKSQPVKLRIQALTSLAKYDDPGAMIITDFKDTSAFGILQTAPGVTANLTSSTAQVKVGDASGCFTATGPQGAKAAPTWAQIGQSFATPKNLSGTGAMGVWIYGDGKGELLNFQIKSPDWMSSATGDHYVIVDFNGWKYFEFVEPEGDRVNDYPWPYAGNAYGVYRELVSYSSLQSISIWCNNLPGDGSITCYISPIKALPLVTNKLVNPAVTINGKTVRFPVAMDANSYLEYNSPTDCKLYDAQGNLVSEVKPEADTPILAAGNNSVNFTCEPPATGSARAIVTITGIGELIGK